MNLTPVVRLVVALIAGFMFAVLVFLASKRWHLTDARHKEMAGVGGLAVGVIVWLLLAPQEGLAEQPAQGEAPSVSVAVPPFVYTVPNIDLTINGPTYSNTECGCGCEEFPSQLADMFTAFANSFFANETANQAAILAAEMATLSPYQAQYNPLYQYATAADYSLFSAVAPGTPQGIMLGNPYDWY